MSVISDLFSGGGIKNAVEGLGGAVQKAVGAFKADPTKLAELEQDLTKAVQAHQEKMTELTNAAEQAYLKDMDSARNMQIEALKQSDVFSKRFVYYLAMGVVFLTMAYDFAFFFVSFPKENRDVIVATSGILNSTALVMVLSFFFGSSKGSKDGADRMDKMMDKVISGNNSK